MLRLHHWLQPDTCFPHARVEEDKALETIAHMLDTTMLFSTARSPGTSTSNCLPKILCLSGHMVGKLDKAMYGTRAGGVGEDDG